MAIRADKSAMGAVNRPLRLVACQQIIHTPHPRARAPSEQQGNASSSGGILSGSYRRRKSASSGQSATKNDAHPNFMVPLQIAKVQSRIHLNNFIMAVKHDLSKWYCSTCHALGGTPMVAPAGPRIDLFTHCGPLHFRVDSPSEDGEDG